MLWPMFQLTGYLKFLVAPQNIGATKFQNTIYRPNISKKISCDLGTSSYADEQSFLSFKCHFNST